MSQIKFIAEGMKWFDKINGNTYHSVRVIRASDGKAIACQFQYGYGNHYRQTALIAMQKAGWIPKEGSEVIEPLSVGIGGLMEHKTYKFSYIDYERLNFYPIYWICTEGLKREVIANGEIIQNE